MILVYKKSWLSVLILLGSTGVSQATECATVLFPDNALPISDNGVTVRQNAKADQEYYLSAGLHTIATKPIEKTFSLEVRADRKYVLTLADDKVTIHSDEPLKCHSKNIAMVPAKQATGRSQIQTNEQLPAPLEYRLRRLMSKIAAYNKSKPDNDNSSNLMPMSRISQFGAVLDDNSSHQTNTLKVLVVSPYSQAKKLGLISGDMITVLGNTPVSVSQQSTANQILQNYLMQLKVGEKITMTVQRSDKELILSHTYKPIIVPEVIYHVGPLTEVITEQ